MSSKEGYNTIVVGGGQAGLAAGYYLTQRGDDFIILDENDKAGISWRNRWDSLRLFTPSQNNHLPGMKFPKPDSYFPTKDEAADYLESYANQFKLPVSYNTKVDELVKHEKGFLLKSGETSFHAQNVIIATGAFRTPFIPVLSHTLSKDIFQMHSVSYRNPSDVPMQNVMVVGAGNSGAEIAVELAKAGKKTWLAGRDVGRAPAQRLGNYFDGKLLWWVLHRVMTVNTPMGRRMKANVLTHGNPLVRIHREDVVRAGVQLATRLITSWDEIPHAQDGHVVAVDGVIWATGFRPDYHWIKLPIFDKTGYPQHVRGVVPDAPGLYFVGLHFQTGLTSSLLGGVGDDAAYITKQIFR